MIISKSLSLCLPSANFKVLDSNLLTNRFLVIKAYKVTQSYMQSFESIDNFPTLNALNENIDENCVHVNESLNLLYELAREEDGSNSHEEERDQIKH